MVVLRSLVCLVIQPALFFGMIKLAELTGTIAQATFVGSTMPPATLSFMFAQQHATYETESLVRVGHIDRSHSLRWASPRSQCVYLCRSRIAEPTLRPDRWFLSL